MRNQFRNPAELLATVIGLLVIFSGVALAAAEPRRTQSPPAKPASVSWDLTAVSKTPHTYPAPEFTTADVTALLERVRSSKATRRGCSPTTEFRNWRPAKRPPPWFWFMAAEERPLIVGSSFGTAEATPPLPWICAAACRCAEEPKKWKRHADGGPPGWGGFLQTDRPAQDQWSYQAVSEYPARTFAAACVPRG